MEVLESVKEIDPNLPVIIVTGTGSEEIAAEAIKRGAADYVIKSPQHIKRLPLTIQSVLESAELERQQNEARQKLDQSEKRYRQLMDTLQEGIWVIDENARTTFVNQALVEMLGYTLEDILGKLVFNYLDKRNSEIVRKKLRQRAEGISENFELELITSTGGRILVLLEASPIFDDLGKYRGAIAAIRDITQEKKNQLALNTYRQQLETLVDNTPGSLWSVDREYRFLGGNQIFKENMIAAFGAEIKTGDIILKRISRSEAREWRAYYDRALAGEKFHLEQQSRYGAVDAWNEYYFNPILDEHDQPRGVMVLANDITESKNVQLSLAENEERYRLLVDQIGSAMFLHDLEGNIIEVNQITADRYGYTRKELLKLNVHDIEPSLAPREGKDIFRKVFKTGPARFDTRHQIKDGTEFPVEISVSPLTFQGNKYLIALASDISDRIRAEENLKTSEKKFRSSFENALIPMVMADQQGNFLDVNEAAALYLFYTVNELSKKSFLDITHPQDRQPSAERFQQCLMDQQPYLIENRYLTSTGKEVVGSTAVSPVFSEQGAFLYAVAHIHDITREKEIEKEILELRDFYHRILSSVQDGIWVTNKNDRMIYINPAMERIAGIDAQQVLGLSVIEDFPAETTDNFLPYYLEAKERRAPVEYQAPVVTPAGRTTFQSGWLVPRYEGDTYQGMICTIQDITDRKQIELKLFENEQLYRQLYQSSGLGVGYYSPEGRVISFNEIALQNMGLELDQVVGKLLTELFPEEGANIYMERIRQTLDEDTMLEFEDHISLPGREGWFLSVYSPVKDQNTQIMGVQIVSLNISERKAFEETLRKTDYIINSTSDAVVTTRPDGTITYWNSGAELIYGYSAQEALGQPISMVYKDEDLPVLEGFITDLLAGNDFRTVEVTNLIKAGEELNLLVTLSTIRDQQGTVTELVGITKDITLIKAAHIELQQEQQRTQQYLDVAEVMLLALDPSGNVKSINPKGCQILGLPEEEILGKNWFDNFLTPEETDKVKEGFKEILSGKMEHAEYFENHIQRPDGSKRLIAWHNSILLDEQNQVTGIFSSGEDITERKAAEIELVKSKETAERYLNIAAEIILSMDRKGTITLLNPNGHHLLGYEPGELNGKNWFEYCVDPHYRKQSKIVFAQMLEGADPNSLPEVGYVKCKDGTIKTIRWRNAYLRDQDGKVTATLSSGENISDEVAALEEVQRNQKLLVSLGQAADQIQNLLDEKKIFQTIGSEIKKLGFDTTIFSFSGDGQELILDYHSYQNKLVRQAMTLTGVDPVGLTFKIKQGGRVSTILTREKSDMFKIDQDILREVLPWLTKKRAEQMIDLFHFGSAILAPLFVDNKPAGLMVVLGTQLKAEDVPPIDLFAHQASTALKNARYALALQARTRELEILSERITEAEEVERTRLSRELHDQVGQSLALLGFNLNQIHDQVKEIPGIKSTQINEAREILAEISSGIREVMDDLRPSILDDYGLFPALTWLADRISERTGLNIDLEGKDFKPRLDSGKEVALFRITQEALTNITRHAQARSVHLVLSAAKDLVTLTLSDDGIGFDPLEINTLSNNKGWGLLNMKERAVRNGGSLEIDARPRKGTTITITMPRK